jgi:hypothetical protein
MFKNDLANGQGTWTGSKKQWLQRYLGPFQDGRPHGKGGEAVFSDGSKFVGAFKEGLPDKGDYVLPESVGILSGKFSGYKLSGKGNYKTKDGDFVEGAPDAANRLHVKGRYLSPHMPITRPSFPSNVTEGVIK